MEPSSDAKDELLAVRLTAIRYLARDTHLFEFRRPDGQDLPAVTPGAHVDVHLGDGLVRQYSLVESGPRADRYLIGVKRDPASRGGSRRLHDEVRVGSAVRISRPRNNFPLDPGDAPSILLAGGIGITPVWCMVQDLVRQGRRWRLHYASRSRADAAFADDLEALGEPVHLHFDDVAGGVMDVAAIVRAAPADAHLYCCGPRPMLKAFEAAALDRAPHTVHVEYFAAAEEAAVAGGYAVVLARSGREIAVAPGQTILVALREAGIDVPSSCEEGVCGACETAVLEGAVDHRDSILTPDERAANNTMMVCCSGSKGGRLVLDR